MTIMLVANNGGHIEQLRTLASRFEVDTDEFWVTVPTPQTESMLEGKRVHWVRPAVTRDWRAAARNASMIAPLFRRHDFSTAVSTGSSLAISALPQAALHRVPAHYVESVTRTDGLSLSGRMLRCTPGVNVYVQWPHLADGAIRFRGSVLDGTVCDSRPERSIRRVVVSLGTHDRFGFRRLLERLVSVFPSDVEVLWQTGATHCGGLGIDARPSVPGSEMEQAIREADVLVAHAGAGIALTSLKQGRVPLLVPRRAEFDEHVDDHQQQIARRLRDMSLAIVREADEVEWSDLVSASRFRASRGPAPRFELVPSGV